MSNPVEAIITGRWTVGYAAENGGICLIKFDFTDRPAITLAIPHDQAEQIARAILEQGKHPPPPSNRRN